MAHTVGRESVPTKVEVRSARWAWIALALWPVMFALGVLAAFGLALLVDADMDSPSTGDSIVIGLVMYPLWAVAPIVGVAAAVRSALSRNRAGLAAAVAWAAVLGWLLATGWNDLGS